MYALFMWPTYYTSGGSADLVDIFDSLEDALEYARENNLNCLNYENIYEIECIYPWLNIGQAESLISRLKERVK